MVKLEKLVLGAMFDSGNSRINVKKHLKSRNESSKLVDSIYSLIAPSVCKKPHLVLQVEGSVGHSNLTLRFPIAILPALWFLDVNYFIYSIFNMLLVAWTRNTTIRWHTTLEVYIRKQINRFSRVTAPYFFEVHDGTAKWRKEVEKILDPSYSLKEGEIQPYG